ncbi:Cingulin [Trichinella spiralis]|uniref:Cingulin n=1 Tax=Trichinella spiralis TaxID=6334 RepID=A0ABR3KP24_TRISP
MGPFLVQVSKAAHLGMVKRAGNRPNTSARSSSIPFAIAVWTNRFANLPAPACGIFILTELVHYIQSASVKGHDIPAKSRVRIVHFFHNIPKFSYRLGMYPYFCILLTVFI